MQLRGGPSTERHGVRTLAARAAARTKEHLRVLRAEALGPLLEAQEIGNLAVGRQESRRVAGLGVVPLQEAEFRISSQFGEDGIIQYLIGKIRIDDPSFVEFGVEDYRQANTRFLLQNNDWRGLILDGSDAHVRHVRRTGLAWRHDLTARAAFITAENINEVLSTSGFTGEIGLLSVDIDGVDYWVLQAINVVRPSILVVEYNSIFGPDASVTVPYSPTFDRNAAHPSGLYFGASLGAMCRLASEKGYRFVGSNSAGNNAFFVRDDIAGSLPRVEPRDAWVGSRFRESRGPDGRLSYVSRRDDRLRLMAECEIVDLDSGRRCTVGHRFDLG